MSDKVDKNRLGSPKAAIKLVFDKETIEQFTKNSPTLNHLQSYHWISTVISYVLALPLISRVLSFTITQLVNVRNAIVFSRFSPRFFHTIHYKIETVVWKVDELFNMLVLREGVDGFINLCKSKHNNKIPGMWIMWFVIDYIANVTDTMLKELIVKPFKLPSLKGRMQKAAKAIQNGETVSQESTDSLRHVFELSVTTKTITHDIHEKLNNDYIQPTKDMAKKNYDSFIKPTRQKIESEYVKPTKQKINDQLDSYVKPTYKTVSNKYEDNLSKSESVPRAIVSTGLDLGSMTVQKLKKTSQDVAEQVSGNIQEQKESKIPSNFTTYAG